MNRRKFIQSMSSLAASAKVGTSQPPPTGKDSADQLVNAFVNPPDAARPWAYSFWMEGNVTKEGISADLEGMKQAGIRGLLFMDGALGNPPGPHRFMSPSWLEMFQHMLAEADRLGLQVNLNNGAGWAGSAGPWVRPEQATQKVIVSETVVEGPSRFDAVLERPAGVIRNFYEDIAVLAYPAPPGGAKPTWRIPDFSSTKSFGGGRDYAGVVPWPRFIPTSAEWPEAGADQRLETAKLQELTARLEPGGRLNWEVPPGRWIVLRFGHTVGNGGTRSVQPEAAGLECDKLSKPALEAHFAGMVGKLAQVAGPLAGRVLVSTHIDSWEGGSGNWTNGFREEFRRRRGYDLLPFLPALNGIVVDSREISERFLWDYRETVCELLLDNYAGHLRELAHKQGLRLSIEAYDGTCDDLRYAGRADEPMGEFWRSCYSGLPLSDLSESMTSAAHVYGKQIIGAEAFTSFRGDFLDHPATLKPLADWAFCTGINRLCISEWVMQPWPRLVPGISFSFIGTVFHSSLTWWAQAKPWHDYLARCQHMLRQGHFVADICFLAPEGAPYRFTPPIPARTRGVIPDRPGYNFDGCPAELVLKEMTVEDSMVVLPSGMRYRLLVLPTYNANDEPVIQLMDRSSATPNDYYYKAAPMPKVRTMTPELLRRVKELVEGGATVLGNRPLKSPSLTGFPRCDEEVRQLADELWGENAGSAGEGERRVGRGRVVWGSTPERVLAAMGVPPDFTCDRELQGGINYTHRRTADGSDIYFVVNKLATTAQGAVSFRTAGKQPEVFWPQTGRIEPVAVFEETSGVTTMPLCLNGNESAFVVFRRGAAVRSRITAVVREGQALWPKPSAESKETDSSFMMAAWAGYHTQTRIELPKEIEGGWAYERNMDVAATGTQVFASPGQGRGGFAVGGNGVVVFQYGPSGAVEPLLAYEGPIAYPTLVGVVYRNRVPKLFLDGKLVKSGPVSRYAEHGSYGLADRRPFAGEIAAVQQFEELLRSASGQALAGFSRSVESPVVDLWHGEIRQSGTYVLKTADGRSRQMAVSLQPPVEIAGPWQVEFDPRWGGPRRVTFEGLQDWSKHSDEGIRYYSGAAIYRAKFNFTRSGRRNPRSRFYLDLGKMSVIAEVILNGRNLGILWNPPFRVNVTDVIKADNTLEVRVVNLWINRLIGDEHLPEDREWKSSPLEPLKSWPKWVQEGKSSPTGRFTFTSARLWRKETPLVESGLLGPVQVIATEKI